MPGWQLENKTCQGGLPTVFYPETAKNASPVYVEREKHKAGAFVGRYWGTHPNHQENWGTPAEYPSGLHSQRGKETGNPGHCMVQNHPCHHFSGDSQEETLGRKPGPTKRRAKAHKQKKTTQLSPTAQPFIPHIIDTPSGDISTIVTLARRGASCGGGDCRRKNKFLKSGWAATPLPPPWHQYSIGNRTHLAGKTNAKRPNSTMETCYSCNCPLLFALV